MCGSRSGPLAGSRGWRSPARPSPAGCSSTWTAPLITAYSDKEGAAPTWKKGYGFHPLGAWIANTRECPDMLLRPGNAGSNTFTDHKEVLDRALKQVPAPFRKRSSSASTAPGQATTW